MAPESSQIRDEIAHTRAELAETVQALGEKADVKGRIRETVADNTAQLHRKATKVASGVGEKVRQVTPDKAREGLATGLTQARRSPSIASIPVAFLAGLLLGRRLGRRA